MALAEVEVVEGLEIELRPLPDLTQGDVVLLGLAVGRIGLREVGEGDEELLPPPVELVQLGLELLELRLQRSRSLAGLRELRIARLAGAGRLFDLAGELVLVRPDRIDPRVELTAAFVDLQELVELIGGAPPRQRRADCLRVATDLLQVERGSVPRARARRRSWSSSAPEPAPR